MLGQEGPVVGSTEAGAAHTGQQLTLARGLLLAIGQATPLFDQLGDEGRLKLLYFVVQTGVEVGIQFRVYEIAHQVLSLSVDL